MNVSEGQCERTCSVKGRSDAVSEFGVPACLVVLGALLDWVSTTSPAAVPVWLPFDFSWFAWLGTWLPVWWYFRGVRLMLPDGRPVTARQVFFVLGMIVIYGVLQTRYLYLAEHEFFLNRIQHVAMHHLGPFLVALGLAGGPIRRGMPKAILGVVDSRLVRLALAPVQQPFVASFLFVGLVGLWLIPEVHFKAMIDDRLFWIMNWSMVLDGLLFWCLVLDPNPAPPARARFGVRIAMAWGVMFPQILFGALIVFARHDIYPYYAYCGRFFPSIGPLYDQLVGGMIVWIPPCMMSAIAGILVINNLRLQEDRSPGAIAQQVNSGTVVTASWTGRE